MLFEESNRGKVNLLIGVLTSTEGGFWIPACAG